MDTPKKPAPVKAAKPAPVKPVKPAQPIAVAAKAIVVPEAAEPAKAVTTKPMPKAAPPAPAAAAPVASKPAAPAPVAAPPVNEVAAKPVAYQKGTSETMTDMNRINETAAAATDKAQAMFADVNDRAKAAVEKGQKFAEELTEFHKGNIEAIVASSRVAAKGLETMGQDAAEQLRKSYEEATAAMKSFAAVKSPTEFFKLQSDYAKSAFDSMVAQTSKNTEASLKLAGDVFQPISNRFAVAAEKMKTAA